MRFSDVLWLFLNRDCGSNSVVLSDFAHSFDESISFEVVVFDFSDAKIDVSVHAAHATMLESDGVSIDQLEYH